MHASPFLFSLSSSPSECTAVCVAEQPAESHLTAFKISINLSLFLQATHACSSLHVVDAQQSVTLIVLSNQQVEKTVQELSKMPFTQFSNVYMVRATSLMLHKYAIL